MKEKYDFRYHPWELTLPGRFLPVHRVNERAEGYCGGKDKECPRSYLKSSSLRRIEELKGGQDGY